MTLEVGDYLKVPMIILAVCQMTKVRNTFQSTHGHFVFSKKLIDFFGNYSGVFFPVIDWQMIAFTLTRLPSPSNFPTTCVATISTKKTATELPNSQLTHPFFLDTCAASGLHGKSKTMWKFYIMDLDRLLFFLTNILLAVTNWSLCLTTSADKLELLLLPL